MRNENHVIIFSPMVNLPLPPWGKCFPQTVNFQNNAPIWVKLVSYERLFFIFFAHLITFFAHIWLLFCAHLFSSFCPFVTKKYQPNQKSPGLGGRMPPLGFKILQQNARFVNQITNLFSETLVERALGRELKWEMSVVRPSVCLSVQSVSWKRLGRFSQFERQSVPNLV